VIVRVGTKRRREGRVTRHGGFDCEEGVWLVAKEELVEMSIVGAGCAVKEKKTCRGEREGHSGCFR